MRRALGDKAATCPHPDAAKAATWNAAGIEEAQPCESPNAARARVKEELPNGVTIYRDVAARLPNISKPAKDIRGLNATMQIKETERFYYD